MCLKKNDIERLDAKQTEVNESSFDQNWIVYGPAGTGKTILALSRMQRLVRLLPDENHIFLSKSKMLSRWVEQAAEDLGVNSYIKTFDQFVWNHVKKIIGMDPFKTDPENLWSEIDWDKTIPIIRERFANDTTIKKISIIVDEAQDIRPGFFEACKIMCSRIFILMDENQKTAIFADTKRTEIATILGIDSAHQKILRVNYRNPEEIKKLSESFYDGDRAELAELPPKELRRNLEAPPTINWMPFDDDSKHNQVRRIISYCGDRPQSTVCVVVPNPKDVKKLGDSFKKAASTASKLKSLPDWSVRGYQPKTFTPCTTDFCSPGIVVSNSINIKGSEFDAVFLVNWDDSKELAAAMYTLISRARTRIEVLSSALPQSKALVRRQFNQAIEENLITEAS